MNFINRDEDDVPDFPEAMWEYAVKYGYCLFSVNITNGDGIANFWAMSTIRPNMGEEITTTDAIICKVVRVAFRSVMTDLGVLLVPQIYAEGPDVDPELSHAD